MPHFQFLSYKSLGHFVLNDGSNSSLDVVQNISKFELCLKGGGGHLFAG